MKRRIALAATGVALSALLGACGWPASPAPEPAPASAPAPPPAPFWHYINDAPSSGDRAPRMLYACWQGLILLTEDDGTVWKGAVTAVRATQGQVCFQ